MDWPSLSELGSAAGTVLWGPTIDPATMAGAGLNKPVDDEMVRQLMTAKSRTGLAKQYTDWAEQHPYLDFAAEQGMNYVLSEIPYAKYIRKAGLGNIADVLEMAQKAGGPIWGENIQDPKVKMTKVSEDPDGAKTYNIHRTEDDSFVGGAKTSYDPDLRQLNLDFGSNKFEKEFGTGQFLHLKNQLKDDHPDADFFHFMRTSGAGPRNKEGELEEVTMPLRRYKEMSPEGQKLYDHYAEVYGSPIVRQNVGKPSDFLDNMGIPMSPVDRETIWLAQQGYLEGAHDEHLPDIIGAARRGASPDDARTFIPHSEPIPTGDWHRGNLNRIMSQMDQLEQGVEVPQSVRTRLHQELGNIDPNDDNAIMHWRENSPLLQETHQAWSKVIQDDGKNGPYELPAFHGGDKSEVEHVGRFYSNDPLHAQSFDPSDETDLIARMKNVKSGKLTTERPLVLQHPDEAFDDPSITQAHVVEKLNLNHGERLAYDRLVRENSPGKIEQFIAQKAKQRGYDSVLRYAPDEDYMELMDLGG